MGGNLVDFQSSVKYMPPPLEQGGETSMSPMVVTAQVPPSMANSSSPASIAAHLLESNWNPFVSMEHHLDFHGSTAPSSYSFGIQANPGMDGFSGYLNDQISGLPWSDRGKASSPFGLDGGGQMEGSLRPSGFFSSAEHGLGKHSKVKKKKKKRMSECGVLDSQSTFQRTQTAEAESNNDGSPESVKLLEEEEEEEGKGEEGEQIPGASAHNKPASKQAGENSSSGDAPKEDYVHVRAKRGRATNSHSLAERVRRERISQRMKFLQDLVPGCSKITGKAVMLDEIINYVQSLQQQVEFLSMKLATVNPEMNFDVQHIFPRDIPCLQTESLAAPSIHPGFGTSHFPFQRPMQQGVMQAEMSTNAWNDDSQNAMQIDFIPSTHIHSTTKSPGSMKMEQ